MRFVLNTHYHGDHTHGNVVFGLKSTIVAHDNVRKRLEAESSFGDQPGARGAAAGAAASSRSTTRVSLHLNGEEVRGQHVPASHTDGDTVVYFTKSNVVHMGDDFFNGVFPFIRPGERRNC